MPPGQFGKIMNSARLRGQEQKKMFNCHHWISRVALFSSFMNFTGLHLCLVWNILNIPEEMSKGTQ